MLALILRGFILGLAIAAPVGPIGVLCIRRTLAQGRRSASYPGSAQPRRTRLWLYRRVRLDRDLGAARTAAGAARSGWRAVPLLSRREDFACPAGCGGRLSRRPGLGGAYFSTFLLTLTNPMTILSFVAVFAGLGVGAGNGYGEPPRSCSACSWARAHGGSC